MKIRIWSVSGYNGYQFDKSMLEDSKWSFSELEEIEPKIRKELETCLNNNGEFYVLSKKKIIKAVYIFKLIKKEGKQILVIDKKIVLKEVEKCIEEFENDLEIVLIETLADRKDIDRTIWKGNEIEVIKNNKKNYDILTFIFWITIGLCFWYTFTNIIWFILYIIIAISFGYITKSEIKVNKKKIEEKEQKNIKD